MTIQGISASLAAAAKSGQTDKLKTAAQGFEAVFLRQMISSMRSASLGDDIFGSDASNQFRDMADARTADNMSKQGRFGIAEMIEKQFEGAAKAGAPAAVDASK